MFFIIVPCSPTFPRSNSISHQPRLRAPNPHSSVSDAAPICFPPLYSTRTSRFQPPSAVRCSLVIVPTCSHARIPCSALPVRRSPREACRLRAFFRTLIFLSPPGRIAAVHISRLGLRFRLSISSTLRSQGYPQVLFEPHLNSHPRGPPQDTPPFSVLVRKWGSRRGCASQYPQPLPTFACKCSFQSSIPKAAGAPGKDGLADHAQSKISNVLSLFFP